MVPVAVKTATPKLPTNQPMTTATTGPAEKKASLAAAAKSPNVTAPSATSSAAMGPSSQPLPAPRYGGADDKGESAHALMSLAGCY